MQLNFTGQVFLVTYNISRHLMGRHTHRLTDAENNALMDFLDKIEADERKSTGRFEEHRDRWIIAEPFGGGGFTGTCAVTGRKSDSLERVALISWAEVPNG